MAPPGGPPAVRVVRNTRPGVDWNTCGQAAIATVLAYHRAGPFAGGGGAFEDGLAIDLVRLIFPPDLPFGLGTSAFRMAAALRTFGLAAERIHSGWFGHDIEFALGSVRDHVARGNPVPVCLDDGRIGGAGGAAHWAVVLAIEGDRVWVGNAGIAGPLDLDAFMSAWSCRMLPWPHNHAAVLAEG